MTVQVGNNLTAYVASTYGTPITVTALTKADPGVATATAHGLTDGDVGIFAITDGMSQLDTQVVRIANSDANSFELEGLDTTNYSTWNTGTFTEITVWNTLCLMTSYSVANAAPTEIDATTTCDIVAKIRFGIPGQKSGTLSIQHDPGVAAMQTLLDASTSTVIPIYFEYPNTVTRYFGAYTAYGGGFAGGVNTLETGEIPITVPAEIIQYTT